MFVNKKNDISRYEFSVLLTILMVLVGMVKPFWEDYYDQQFQAFFENDTEQISSVDYEIKQNVSHESIDFGELRENQD